MAQLANQSEMTFAEEALIVDAQLFLHNLMEDKGVSRSQLAAMLGLSKARITQIFSDECENLTLRLLARVAHALGERVELDSEHFRNARIAAEIKSITEDPTSNVHSLWERTCPGAEGFSEPKSHRLDYFIDRSLENLEAAHD